VDASRRDIPSRINVGLIIVAFVAALLIVSSTSGECRSDADTVRFDIGVVLWLLALIGLVATHRRRRRADDVRRGLWVAAAGCTVTLFVTVVVAFDDGVESDSGVCVWPD
jgi:peptidoglycan/LPS O-acetylase OafA/YrhL